MATLGKFIGKMEKKVCYYEKWVGRHASFPPRRSVNFDALQRIQNGVLNFNFSSRQDHFSHFIKNSTKKQKRFDRIGYKIRTMKFGIHSWIL